MTDTLVIGVDGEHPQADAIAKAAAIIQRGGLVAFPTETVYGLGANAFDEAAIKRIFVAKGRPADNPIIVHVANRAMLERVATEVSDAAAALIEAFWPGPLTLVLKRQPEVAPSVSAGLDTVAVRMPQHSIALALIETADLPIAAPSANRSGRPSPTRAAHVLEDLGGRIDLILDGGETRIGIESTVVDMTTDAPVILRPGWITPEDVQAIIGEVRLSGLHAEARRSPGTRYRHYRPQAPIVLVERATPQRLYEICAQRLKTGAVAYLGHTPLAITDARFSAILLKNRPEEYARSLYAALRELDEKRPSVIVIEAIDATGAGAAVMDRLRRAASEEVAGDS